MNEISPPMTAASRADEAAVQAVYDAIDKANHSQPDDLPYAAAIQAIARVAVAAARPHIAAQIAEEIALKLLSQRTHIPPSYDPTRKYAVAQRDTLNRAARWARQIGDICTCDREPHSIECPKYGGDQ